MHENFEWKTLRPSLLHGKGSSKSDSDIIKYPLLTDNGLDSDVSTDSSTLSSQQDDSSVGKSQTENLNAEMEAQDVRDSISTHESQPLTPDGAVTPVERFTPTIVLRRKQSVDKSKEEGMARPSFGKRHTINEIPDIKNGKTEEEVDESAPLRVRFSDEHKIPSSEESSEKNPASPVSPLSIKKRSVGSETLSRPVFPKRHTFNEVTEYSKVKAEAQNTMNSPSLHVRFSDDVKLPPPTPPAPPSPPPPLKEAPKKHTPPVPLSKRIYTCDNDDDDTSSRPLFPKRHTFNEVTEYLKSVEEAKKQNASPSLHVRFRKDVKKSLPAEEVLERHSSPLRLSRKLYKCDDDDENLSRPSFSKRHTVAGGETEHSSSKVDAHNAHGSNPMQVRFRDDVKFTPSKESPEPSPPSPPSHLLSSKKYDNDENDSVLSRPTFSQRHTVTGSETENPRYRPQIMFSPPQETVKDSRRSRSSSLQERRTTQDPPGASGATLRQRHSRRENPQRPSSRQERTRSRAMVTSLPPKTENGFVSRVHQLETIQDQPIDSAPLRHSFQDRISSVAQHVSYQHQNQNQHASRVAYLQHRARGLRGSTSASGSSCSVGPELHSNHQPLNDLPLPLANGAATRRDASVKGEDRGRRRKKSRSLSRSISRSRDRKSGVGGSFTSVKSSGSVSENSDPRVSITLTRGNSSQSKITERPKMHSLKNKYHEASAQCAPDLDFPKRNTFAVNEEGRKVCQEEAQVVRSRSFEEDETPEAPCGADDENTVATAKGSSKIRSKLSIAKSFARFASRALPVSRGKKNSRVRPDASSSNEKDDAAHQSSCTKGANVLVNI